MFFSKSGGLRIEAEAIADQIKNLSVEEVEALEVRKLTLKDGLNSFSARVADLPERERNATFSLLYKEITDLIFDFHLSIEARDSRAKIEGSKTKEEKLVAAREFRATADDLAMIYGVE